MGEERTKIFISHASPGDNPFATWLAARLSMAGYEVWCDQQKLLGGEDFWADIESVLRTRTVKFVLVISAKLRDANGQLRDGVAKEIALANTLKKKLPDAYFVIPALVDDTPFDEFGIEFIRLNGIDFRANWAAGLSRLMEVLERDSVVHSTSVAATSLEAWRSVHTALSRNLATTPEVLQSNWLSIEKLPETIEFYDIQVPLSFSEIRSIASDCPLPCSDHGRLLASFASFDELSAALPESVPIKARGTLATRDFLAGRTGDILGIAPSDARNKVSSLVRQSWDRSMATRGLTRYAMANDIAAWWFPLGTPEDGQLRYTDRSGKARRRAVMGTRGKKETEEGAEMPRCHWHLGFTGAAFIGDASHIALRPRIIITEDQITPLDNKTKLNSVRRAVTNMWFNDKWRGLVMGFCAWLADDDGHIRLAAGEHGQITLSPLPMEFDIPVGVATDPASQIPTEEDEERFETEETVLRLSDPAFSALDEEDDE
jgi:hypothetical protein